MAIRPGEPSGLHCSSENTRSQKKPEPQSTMLQGLMGKHCTGTVGSASAMHVKPNGQLIVAHVSGSGSHCATVGHSSMLLLRHSSLGSKILVQTLLGGQTVSAQGSATTHSDFFWHSSMPS